MKVSESVSPLRLRATCDARQLLLVGGQKKRPAKVTNLMAEEHVAAEEEGRDRERNG